MNETVNPITAQLGAAPGALIHIGQAPDAATRISLMEFTRDSFREQTCSAEALETCCREALRSEGISWINVDGIHDPAVIQSIGDALGLHPLTCDDIMNSSQRPKVEDFATYRFLAVKMARTTAGDVHAGAALLRLQHISIVVTKQVVVSFQERASHAFDPVQERIRTGRGQVRYRGADYLAYALLDAVVDYYFAVTEAVSERIEAIEEQLSERADEEVLAEIHGVKRDLVHLRRAVWPLREVSTSLQSRATKQVAKSTLAYLRDIHDHTMQVLELVDTMRELIAGGLLIVFRRKRWL